MDILTKICIISAVLGIALLVVISDKIDLPTSTISSITKESLNKEVRIEGTIKSIVKKDSLAILNIKDKSSFIDVVLFKPENIDLEKGSFVEIYGKVSVYNDNIQIIAEKVRRIN